jgi:hypothetical protein
MMEWEHSECSTLPALLCGHSTFFMQKIFVFHAPVRVEYNWSW